MLQLLQKKKGKTPNAFSIPSPPPFLLLDPGAGINIPDPQHISPLVFLCAFMLVRRRMYLLDYFGFYNWYCMYSPVNTLHYRILSILQCL